MRRTLDGAQRRASPLGYSYSVNQGTAESCSAIVLTLRTARARWLWLEVPASSSRMSAFGATRPSQRHDPDRFSGSSVTVQGNGGSGVTMSWMSSSGAVEDHWPARYRAACEGSFGGSEASAMSGRVGGRPPRGRA